MFDSLSEKLQETLADVRQRGTLTEEDIDKAMREIRLALLEADVNFKVVKSFTASVKERCLTEEVIGQLNPGQQVIKIVDEELTDADGRRGRGHHLLAPAADGDPDGRAAGLGQDDRDGQARALPARASTPPRSRSRRATSTGPAAVEQLVKVGGQAGADRLRAAAPTRDPVEIAAWALDQARARAGQGRADRRHLRPPARRRGADGRAGDDQEARSTRTACCWWSTR